MLGRKIKVKKSIAKNYIYNLTYQLLTIVLPLITTPYLSRVLGAEPIGIYGYTSSIVTYFILFGSLGIAMYGQREIAYLQNDKKQRTKVFWEIIIVRAFFLIISMMLFYFIFGIQGEYTLYYRILLLQIIAAVFDISWLFQGIEEFDKTVIRNMIVKALSLVLIFTLVKQVGDLWKYFLIYVGAELIGNFSLWFYLPKYLEKIEIKTLKLKKHIKPAILLFIPQIAVQIYTVLDKTMIGVMTNNMAEVGYYEQAQKIVRAMTMVVTALGTVMSSRIASEYAKGKKEEISKCLQQSFHFAWFLGIPMMLGLIAITKGFVPWFFGEEFKPVVGILIATSPIILAIGLNNITGIQYLIQTGNEKLFTKSVVIGAIINVIFNLILIPLTGAIGAAIASVLAETTILIVQLSYLKDKMNLLEILKISWKCWISGIIMFVGVFLIDNFLEKTAVNTLIEIVIGGIIYIIMLFLLKYEFLHNIIQQVKNTIKAKITLGKEN